MATSCNDMERQGQVRQWMDSDRPWRQFSNSTPAVFYPRVRSLPISNLYCRICVPRSRFYWSIFHHLVSICARTATTKAWRWSSRKRCAGWFPFFVCLSFGRKCFSVMLVVFLKDRWCWFHRGYRIGDILKQKTECKLFLFSGPPSGYLVQVSIPGSIGAERTAAFKHLCDYTQLHLL